MGIVNREEYSYGFVWMLNGQPISRERIVRTSRCWKADAECQIEFTLDPPCQCDEARALVLWRKRLC